MPCLRSIVQRGAPAGIPAFLQVAPVAFGGAAVFHGLRRLGAEASLFSGLGAPLDALGCLCVELLRYRGRATVFADALDDDGVRYLGLPDGQHVSNAYLF